MKKMTAFIASGLIVAAVFVMALAACNIPPQPIQPLPTTAAQGQAMTDQKTVREVFRTLAYTSSQTAYSIPQDGGAYGAVQLQAVSDAVSETNYVVQFSIQPLGCNNANLTWTDVVTISPGAGASALDEVDMAGRCIRIKSTSAASVFTPTVYMRFVNR